MIGCIGKDKKITDRIVELAKTTAARSTHDFRLGAVIFKGRNVISMGWNKAEKTHPKSNTPYGRIHAEFDAINSAGTDIVGADIYVHRLLKNGNPGLSRPCRGCMTKLREAGIRNIFFSS